MNNYEKIKKMSIEEMAALIVGAQVSTIITIQKTLCACLPIPTEEKYKKLIEDEIKLLQAESEA